MRFLFIILFIFSLGIARAQNPVIINDSATIFNLGSQSEFLEDKDGKLTIEQLLKNDNPGAFTLNNHQAVHFGISASFFWVRATIENRIAQPLQLKIGNHALADIRVFETKNGKIIKQYQSGSWVPYEKKVIKDIEFIFPLHVHQFDTATIYVRVRHDRGTEYAFQVATAAAFYEAASSSTLMEGIYYGFMLLMVLYNLFIYFSLRDSSYIYYVAYIFFMGLLNATINGYATKYLWPSAPALTQYEDVVAAFVGMSGLLFAAKFLNTKNNAPVFHKIFTGLFVCYIAVIIVILAGNFRLGTIIVELISILLVIIFFVAAYMTLKKGYRPAKFFLIAWSFLLLSVIVFILQDYKIFPYNPFTVNSLQIGSAVEALLLSFALANRIHVYKREKEQAQLEVLVSLKQNEKLITEQKAILEQTVEERTKELRAANKDLITAVDNLKATQTQLVQKEKMASLGELTAGIAHEIQNPLNFVNNFSDINTELTQELRQEITKLHLSGNAKDSIEPLLNHLEDNNQKITHHGKRADAIVKGMLQHSRTSTGEKEPSDINALTDEYLRLSYHGLRAKDKTFNAAFTTDYDENLGTVHIVPQDIGRVLLNLFNNAFYSVNEKKKQQLSGYSPMVGVTTKKQGDKVIITVRDNGIGVPQRIIDKIFQPFYTTKPTGEGTGLGLSLSYDVITKGHDGLLKVNTKEGEFAEFVIELPLNAKPKE